MARVSEKALRPRQYVFNRLPAERSKKLEEGVRKLLEKEKLAALSARASVRAVESIRAARHAERVMDGNTDIAPENEHIRALEKELDELRQKRRSLFELLKESLNSADTEKDVHMTDQHGPVQSSDGDTLHKDNLKNEGERQSKEEPIEAS